MLHVCYCYAIINAILELKIFNSNVIYFLLEKRYRTWTNGRIERVSNRTTIIYLFLNSFSYAVLRLQIETSYTPIVERVPAEVRESKLFFIALKPISKSFPNMERETFRRSSAATVRSADFRAGFIKNDVVFFVFMLMRTTRRPCADKPVRASNSNRLTKRPGTAL